MIATTLRLLASLIIAALAGAAGAQQNIETPEFEVTAGEVVTAILTVDIDRLFSQSQFGQRVAQSYAAEREALAMENSRIAAALREEELALATQRADMALTVFRTEAEAFDEKAQSIRRAQDAKERALEDTLVQGRDQFLEVTRPILGQLMVDRGAFAILDRRSVLLSLGSIDVTDDAIARIDAAIGDGADATQETGPDLDPDAAPEN
jgi:Skp family chaperone for outer membrane proteins